jgi:hypothetical protein
VGDYKWRVGESVFGACEVSRTIWRIIEMKVALPEANNEAGQGISRSSEPEDLKIQRWEPYAGYISTVTLHYALPRLIPCLLCRE